MIPIRALRPAAIDREPEPRIDPVTGQRLHDQSAVRVRLEGKSLGAPVAWTFIAPS